MKEREGLDQESVSRIESFIGTVGESMTSVFRSLIELQEKRNGKIQFT